MKRIFNKRIVLFIWIGVAFTAMWSFSHLSKYSEAPGGRILNEAWRSIYLVFANYLLFEVSYRKLPFNGWRIIPSSLLLFIQFFISGIILTLWRKIGIELHTYEDYSNYKTVEEAIEHQLNGMASSVVFFGIVRHFYDHFQLRQASQKLRIEKQEAELNFLRSQTNPHFLFNTLNNIYALAQERSSLAPESVLRLSKILRYMLYETSTAYVAIEKELKIINDYIELEKLRYDESLRVNFSHDIEDMQQAIPPLLLIPLVENAFKHGTAETRERPFIDIYLRTGQRKLEMKVVNSTEELADEQAVKENIGLSNLRRQLELLYKSYDLKIEKANYRFIATLTIDLSSHV